jgi:hypothetical protein
LTSFSLLLIFALSPLSLIFLFVLVALLFLACFVSQDQQFAPRTACNYRCSGAAGPSGGRPHRLPRSDWDGTRARTDACSSPAGLPHLNSAQCACHFSEAEMAALI